MSSAVLVGAGDKSGSVGMWNVESGQVPYLFRPHCRPVSCLGWDKSDKYKLVSTSYDNTVRVLDMTKQVYSLLYVNKVDDGVSTNYHCQRDDNTFLVSDTGGRVSLVDPRVNNSNAAVDSYRVYDKAQGIPKAVDVHPSRQHLFLCSTNKGQCDIFDIRGTARGPLAPVTRLIGHTRGLSSAAFSPMSGNRVASLAYDDRLRLFDTSGADGEVLPSHEVYHNNFTGRWLTPFRVSWWPGRD